MVSELQARGRRARSLPEDLVPQADAQQRYPPLEQLGAETHGVWQARWVTGAVRQHHTVGLVAEHVVDARVLVHQNYLDTTGAQCTQLVVLDSVIDDDDARSRERAGAAGELDAAMQRSVERLGEHAPFLRERDSAHQVLVAHERRVPRGVHERSALNRAGHREDATQRPVIAQMPRQRPCVDPAEARHPEAAQLIVQRPLGATMPDVG